jgi:hypothetical protein
MLKSPNRPTLYLDEVQERIERLEGLVITAYDEGHKNGSVPGRPGRITGWMNSKTRQKLVAERFCRRIEENDA